MKQLNKIVERRIYKGKPIRERNASVPVADNHSKKAQMPKTTLQQ